MSKATLTVGSEILTDKGPCLVENLRAGAKVITKDCGIQNLRYVAFRDVDLTTMPSSVPIKIDCRHLGFERFCYFEPDQYISMRHQMFDMMFGANRVLVRCGDLVDQPGITQTTGLKSVTFVALGFDRRQIISCNGAQIETGAPNQKSAHMRLGAEEARLAFQLMIPKQFQPKRHSFPLH